MKLFKKSVVTGILVLSGISFISNSAQAGWFGKKDDAETCKAKFEDKCQAVEVAKEGRQDEFSNFYTLVDKLKSDLQSLRDAQTVSQKIANELDAAYEAWKHDGFRIDSTSYTGYAVCKSKFADQNREVAEFEELVKSEMKDMIKFISSEKAKQNYISSLNDVLEAFYNYSAAAAREAVPTVR
ncbi:MAG: hypothetical protein Q4D57_00620 [Clostridia bacterium]|nr:hypothetical protein [Clostridia bacterium]